MEDRASASGNPEMRGFSDAVDVGSILNSDDSDLLPGIHLRSVQRVVCDSTQDIRKDLVHGVPSSISLQEGQGPQDTSRPQCRLRHRQMAAGFSCEIVRAEMDPDFSKEQLADLFISSACLISVKQSSATKKIIIILENLDKSSLSELLGDFWGPLENHSTERPCTFQKRNVTSECYCFHENHFLMGTIAKACVQGSDLLVQQHFHWVQLQWDGEPVHGLLQRFLRREVVNELSGEPLRRIDFTCFERKVPSFKLYTFLRCV
ncbi:hypothetical protein CB1_001755002 [Camelus ferus]|nr:hypothetical protein CB1_001755002 [Camelus ferus]